jgi:hypothetical protein
VRQKISKFEIFWLASGIPSLPVDLTGSNWAHSKYKHTSSFTCFEAGIPETFSASPKVIGHQINELDKKEGSYFLINF